MCTGNHQWQVQKHWAPRGSPDRWKQDVNSIFLQPWKWCGYLPGTSSGGEGSKREERCVPEVCFWGLHELVSASQVWGEGASVRGHEAANCYIVMVMVWLELVLVLYKLWSSVFELCALCNFFHGLSDRIWGLSVGVQSELCISPCMFII